MTETYTVGIVGFGTMGRGIARVFAASGADVRVREPDEAALDRGRAALEADLERAVQRGRTSDADRTALLDLITSTTSLAETVADADLVIEAVPEQLDLKIEIFAEIEPHAPTGALLATNTSGLSVTRIAASTTRPEHVVGLHFFNPVHRMELVEIVRGLETSDDALARARAACERIGKTTVTVEDRAGFATSRINAMIGNEAFYMLMEGVASAEDIDTAMKLALNHPMGPFELVDLVGLDTRLSVLRHLHRVHGEKFRPCPLLETYVEAGRLGRKAGRGVFAYDETGSRVA